MNTVMNDFNQSKTQQGQGFEEYPDMPIDLNNVVTQRTTQKQRSFDPHQVMVNKVKMDKGDSDAELPAVVQWPEEDVLALENFCKEHGLSGFSCGRMSPIAALAVLKSKLGIGDAPLAERIPYGYQKIGVEKKILHG